MIVVADQLLLVSHKVQKLAGNPGILTGHRSYATQHLAGPQRNIAEIANRRRDDVETGLKRCFHD